MTGKGYCEEKNCSCHNFKTISESEVKANQEHDKESFTKKPEQEGPYKVEVGHNDDGEEYEVITGPNFAKYQNDFLEAEHLNIAYLEGVRSQQAKVEMWEKMWEKFFDRLRAIDIPMASYREVRTLMIELEKEP
jgi:hypothetical protein